VVEVVYQEATAKQHTSAYLRPAWKLPSFRHAVIAFREVRRSFATSSGVSRGGRACSFIAAVPPPFPLMPRSSTRCPEKLGHNREMRLIVQPHIVPGTVSHAVSLDGWKVFPHFLAELRGVQWLIPTLLGPFRVVLVEKSTTNRRSWADGHVLGQEYSGGIAFQPIFLENRLASRWLGEVAVGTQALQPFDCPEENSRQLLLKFLRQVAVLSLRWNRIPEGKQEHPTPDPHRPVFEPGSVIRREDQSRRRVALHPIDPLPVKIHPVGGCELLQ
jgi:hypothetical protein